MRISAVLINDYSKRRIEKWEKSRHIRLLPRDFLLQLPVR
jgi:hypothetical protein